MRESSSLYIYLSTKSFNIITAPMQFSFSKLDILSPTWDASGGNAASKVNIFGGTWLAATLFWEEELSVWLGDGSMMVICFFLGSTLRKELDSAASDWDTGHTRTITFTWGRKQTFGHINQLDLKWGEQTHLKKKKVNWLVHKYFVVK